MNKNLIKWLMISVVAFAGLANAQTKEVNVTKSHLWVKGELKVAINSHWGFITQEGSRYNITLDKSVNGKTIDDKAEKFWLQEFWIGPSYKGKIMDNLSYSVSLLYQPQLWYPDETKNDFYFRNTLTSGLNLNLKVNKLGFQYRLMPWVLFQADQGNNQNLDNELIVRNLLGVSYQVNNFWKVSLSEEVFLKPTADDDDLDGSEVFYRNAIWAGFSFMPVKTVSLKLMYVPFYTNKTDSKTLKTSATDHYIYVEFSKSLDFSKKKAK